jgi:hypothetical protein
MLSILASFGNIQLMAILHFVSKVLPGEIRRDGSLEKISERSKISRNSARKTHPIGKLDQATPATPGAVQINTPPPTRRKPFSQKPSSSQKPESDYGGAGKITSAAYISLEKLSFEKDRYAGISDWNFGSISCEI